MNSAKRKTLSLPKKETPQIEETKTADNLPIILDFIEFLLPCRKFDISYKVSEKGAVSLTSEFLLRLLYSVDGMDESAIATFFGFDNREFNFVMSEVTSRDYVSRREGKAWLTETGRLLFKESDSVPQILKVEKRNRRVGFDLLSLSPQESERLSIFAMKLQELPIQDVELLANATKYIPKSFQKHFSEISWSKNGADKQEFLYSVDAVSAENKFYSIVPVFVSSNANHPSTAESNLINWKTGHELDDRSQVIEAISKHIHGLEVSKRPDDSYSYNKLNELAPDFLKDFMRKDGLSIERYFKIALTRVGDLRSDRKTVPILGSLFTPDNNSRLLSAIEYGLKSAHETTSKNKLYWLIPNIDWGFTQVLPLTLDLIKQKITEAEGTNIHQNVESNSDYFECIALTQNHAHQPHIKNVFTSQSRLSEHSSIPPSLEILYIPDVLVAALVHAPIMVNKGFPVPLGFLSFDQSIINNANKLINELVS